MIRESNGFGDRALATFQTHVTGNESVGIEGKYHVLCRDKDGNLKWEEEFENQVTQAGKIFMFQQTLLTSPVALVGPFLGLAGVTGGTVAAGSFVVGATYQILVVGSTNFTLIGASANTVGVVFTATGAGTGSGTATVIGTFSPTDTMASHAGWTEFVNYTVGGSAVRGTAVFTTPTGNSSTTPGLNIVTAAAASITYLITSTGGNIGGCFLVTGTGAVNTQSSTAGTLYSAGSFAVPKATTAGDTVAVTYSTTATS
jgi:hypothetical protein